MSLSKTQESIPLAEKGVYQAPLPTDLRSPCPIVNILANHGWIPRDGRNVRQAELRAAMYELGVSTTISSTLTYGAYLEHHESPSSGWWAFLSGPFAYMLKQFALRDENQVDADGYPCLNLNQLGRHGAIEHDVSLSRRDAAQGDNLSSQKDLVASLISSSKDGKEITTHDLAGFRRRRLEQQRRDNPSLEFTSAQNQMSCAEAAFLQKLFGASERSWAIPVPYIKAIFEEERLPVKEGWKRRYWWSLGFLELFSQTKVLKKVIGPVE